MKNKTCFKKMSFLLKNRTTRIFGRIDWYLVFFVFGVAVLCFLAGGFMGLNDKQPFRSIQANFILGKEAAKQYLDQRPKIVQKKYHQYSGVRDSNQLHEPEGLLLLQGWFSDGPQIRLIDYSGEILHQWFVDFFEIWPNPSHIKPSSRIPNSRFNYHTQGFSMQKNGSVVVEIADLGAAKLNLCSEVIWTVDRSVHHVIQPDGTGGFWMAGHRDFDKIPEEHLFGTVTRSLLSRSNGRYENVLLHVNSAGKIINEISILEGLSQIQYEHKIYDVLQIKRIDPTHINDIELVPESLANKLVGVKPGDLLVSIRQMHMLAIFSADNGEIVWTQTGPWIRQHDPDITVDGKIRVFNNGGNPNLGFHDISGSNIVEFEPSDGSWQILLPKEETSYFYSDIMGSYQALPNGQHLVTESRKGRVLQFSSEGELNWEYVAEYDEEYAALIAIAEWIPQDFFEIEDWHCQAGIGAFE